MSKAAKKNKFAVINIDDPFGVQIADCAAGDVISYSSARRSADVFAEKFSIDEKGIRALVQTPWGKLHINSNLIGDYNLSNILASVSVALCLGSPAEGVASALCSPVFVPGRLERVENQSAAVDVFVDYAHTADALERALRAVRPLCRGRMFVVFGCGGDRDRGKRPDMGRVASKGADVVVLTSDNPRSENPASIIEEIESGISGGICETVKITDRREAISYAVFSAAPGDFVLIAGKGHEKYQDIGGENFAFDDRKCAADFLRRREGPG